MKMDWTRQSRQIKQQIHQNTQRIETSHFLPNTGCAEQRLIMNPCEVYGREIAEISTLYVEVEYKREYPTQRVQHHRMIRLWESRDEKERHILCSDAIQST